MQPRSVRKELETRRKVLSGKILSTMESTRGQENGREIFKDPYGNAGLMLDDEIAASMVERRVAMLEQVDRALEDIEAGRYGICHDCSEEIAPARLRVVPFATRCVSCQAAHEKFRRAA